MGYMEQKMDELIESGFHLENEMAELVEKVEKALGSKHSEWGMVDPRKLVYTVISCNERHPNNTIHEDGEQRSSLKPTDGLVVMCEYCGQEILNRRL